MKPVEGDVDRLQPKPAQTLQSRGLSWRNEDAWFCALKRTPTLPNSSYYPLESHGEEGGSSSPGLVFDPLVRVEAFSFFLNQSRCERGCGGGLPLVLWCVNFSVSGAEPLRRENRLKQPGKFKPLTAKVTSRSGGGVHVQCSLFIGQVCFRSPPPPHRSNFSTLRLQGGNSSIPRTDSKVKS